MNRPTLLLQGHARRRQEAAVRRADAAGAAADRAVGGVWRQLLALLRDSDGDPFAAERQARLVFAPLAFRVASALQAGLYELAWWGWQSERAGLEKVLPARYLEVTALGAGRKGMNNPAPSILTEAEGGDEPSAAALFDLLFPPPTEDEIARLVGDGWYQALARSTRLATPQKLADIVGAGYAAGKTQKEIARDLLPAVEGVRVSARRVARTEGLRVAHASQMAAHESLGDLVSGYTIHATLDARTRPAHRARDGRTWMKDSGTPMEKALHMEGPTLPDGFN